MAPTVLLLAAREDGESARVAHQLTRRGHQVAWLDLSWFPQHCQVDAHLSADGWQGWITTPNDKIDLTDIKAIYNRHCPPFDPPQGLSEPEHRFAIVESRFGLGGILTSLPARWTSHPSAIADAEYKPVQLAAAARVCLDIPPTWAGNTPDAARAFITGQPEGAVYKPFMHKVLSEQDTVKVIYTSGADADAVDDRVAATMHQLQARVNGARDVRALVTTSGCQAVEIIYDGPAHLDYRNHYDRVSYRRTHLPDDVAARCRSLLVDLGLHLGVVDLARTPDNAFWFYEVNPAGQWAWLEEETGAPMAALVADELTGGTT